MNVSIAREKIGEVLLSAKKKLETAGLTVKTNTFYTDKNLAESNDFTPKSILLFGNITFGYEDMEDDDYCNYSICCEIKTALIDEKELEDGIDGFNGEIDGILKTLTEATNPKIVIDGLSRKQTEEAEEAAKEFSKEMRKIKLKLYGAIAGIAVIIGAVLIFVPLLT